jgi:hypothetical protein
MDEQSIVTVGCVLDGVQTIIKRIKADGDIYKDIIDVYLLAKYMIQAGYVLSRQGGG